MSKTSDDIIGFVRSELDAALRFLAEVPRPLSNAPEASRQLLSYWMHLKRFELGPEDVELMQAAEVYVFENSQFLVEQLQNDRAHLELLERFEGLDEAWSSFSIDDDAESLLDSAIELFDLCDELDLAAVAVEYMRDADNQAAMVGDEECSEIRDRALFASLLLDRFGYLLIDVEHYTSAFLSAYKPFEEMPASLGNSILKFGDIKALYHETYPATQDDSLAPVVESAASGDEVASDNVVVFMPGDLQPIERESSDESERRYDLAAADELQFQIPDGEDYTFWRTDQLSIGMVEVAVSPESISVRLLTTSIPEPDSIKLQDRQSKVLQETTWVKLPGDLGFALRKPFARVGSFCRILIAEAFAIDFNDEGASQ